MLHFCLRNVISNVRWGGLSPNLFTRGEKKDINNMGYELSPSCGTSSRTTVRPGSLSSFARVP
jgi:hypothetical protein